MDVLASERIDEDHRTRVGPANRARSRLLMATMRVCSNHEARGSVVIDDVVKAADVSRGTFYKYFVSFDEALDAIGRELADEMTRGMMPVYDAMQEPLHRTAAGLQLFLRRGAVDPVWGRFVSNTDHLIKDRALNYNIRRDLEAGRASGDYSFLSVETAKHFLLGAAKGGIQRFVLGGAELDHIFDLTGMILCGLGADAVKADSAIHHAHAYLRTTAGSILSWWKELPDPPPSQDLGFEKAKCLQQAG